jgi:hypothetical protein
LACQISSPQIATVGNFAINEDDFLARTKILSLDDTSQAQSNALYQLCMTYCFENIAQQYKYTLTDEMLLQESERIDSTSLLPEKIQQIKALCKDEKQYRQVYLKADLYPRWVEYQFDNNNALHYPKAEVANEVFTQALLNDEVFEKDTFLTYPIYTFWVTPNGIEPFIKQEEVPNNTMQYENTALKKSVIKKVEATLQTKKNQMTNELLILLSELEEGQLHPRVIDTPKSFWILRHSGKYETKYKVKVINVPKLDFYIWLEQEIKKIPVKVKDKKMWESMLNDIPSAKKIFNFN